MPRAKTPFQTCLAELRKRGLLMASDGVLSSVTTIVCGHTIKGSWWADASSQEIFDLLERLESHKDVLVVKLVAGKVTLVHRRLWPDVLAMALSGAPWQVAWLPPREVKLLEHVEKEGRVIVDRALVDAFDATPAKFGKMLEARLLVLSSSEHTESGAHVRTLTSWWTWADEKGVAPTADIDEARERIEAAAKALGPKARLPWFRSPVRHRHGPGIP